jgi:hypothetical protein
MRELIQIGNRWLFYDTQLGLGRRFLAKFRDLLFWTFLLGGLYLSNHLHNFGPFEFARAEVDGRLLRAAAERRPVRAPNVRIVAITPSDFETYFGGTTPYPPTALQQAVCAILRGGPRLLVVDVDTSHPAFARMALPHARVPVVWARGAHYNSASPPALIPDAVLGGQELRPPHTHGLAVSFPAVDCSVREFPREIDTSNRPNADSLHWAAVRALNPTLRRSSSAEPLEVPVFDRYFQFDTFPLDDFNPAKTANLPACLNPREDFPSSNEPLDPRVAGKVIILAGAYSNNDLYKTAFGYRTGGEIVASAIEHELNADASSEMTTFEEWLLEALLAVAIVFLHTLFRPVAALVVSVLGLGTLIWYGAWIAFIFAGYRASAVPFLAAIVMEQLSKSAVVGEHLAGEVSGQQARFSS